MVVSIDWKVVEEHYQKQLNNPRRLRLDAEALRWSPLLPGHNISSQQDSDEVKQGVMTMDIAWLMLLVFEVHYIKKLVLLAFKVYYIKNLFIDCAIKKKLAVKWIMLKLVFLYKSSCFCGINIKTRSRYIVDKVIYQENNFESA